MTDETKPKRKRTKRLDKYGRGVFDAVVLVYEWHGDDVQAREILSLVGITDKKTACGRAGREMASRLADLWRKDEVRARRRKSDEDIHPPAWTHETGDP